MYSLRFIDDPNYYAVYFRKTTRQLESSLWPEAVSLFLPFITYQEGPNKGKYIGQAKIRERDHLIIFPSGARVQFSYLDTDKRAQENWQGAQLTAVFFDEFTHFSAHVFNYLRTRLRSKAKVPSFMRCSLNPDPGHHVLDWLDAFIDQDTGLAIDELSGKIRYFIFNEGKLVTSWSYEELKNDYPDKNPRTYTFVPSKLTDNKKMLSLNPDYADELSANSKAEKAALLDGNWKFQTGDIRYFSRDWLKTTDTLPNNVVACRAWDKASIDITVDRRADFTATIKMYRDRDGYFYIVGDHISTCRDGESRIYGKFRKRPGDRDNIILDQALADGSECKVVFAIDPGQAGKVEYEESAKKLILQGISVKPDPFPNNKSKVDRFSPFSSACENGLVYIIPSTFRSKETLNDLYFELESFTGEKSTIHDDLADACASAFNFLCKAKPYKTLQTPTINSPTAIANRDRPI